MRAVSTLTAIATALWFAATSAHAIGFGRVSNATQLGQPLNFAAAVRVESDETLPRECVFAEVFSGDNRLQPGQIRVTLEGAADSPDRSVRVTSNTPIDEPVVTVNVTLGCVAKVTRKFVAFVDPPLPNLAQASPADVLPPQRLDSQVAPLVRMVEGDGPVRAIPAPPERGRSVARTRVSPRGAAVAMQTVPPVGETAAVPAPRTPKPRQAAPAVRATAPVPVAKGPQLKLEAAPLIVARNPASSASTPIAVAPVPVAASESASAALADESALQLAKERQRIQVLEDGLAKLHQDAQATQKALAEMQVQLKTAESDRYANPLVYALAGLSALLAIAVAALWWRQSRARSNSQWWAAPAPAAAAARPGVDDGTASAPLPLGATPTAADAFDLSPTASVTGEIDEPDPMVAASPTRPSPLSAAAPTPAPTRGASVEELIDLEQQAEFFVVLGQDEAAIELLMSHVRNDGGISPLPYLKLLEIYRRRDEQDAYERIRDRFNRRFNAYAPEWGSDLQQGRTLTDYAETIGRLEAMWSSPARVMETLDASLFRRNKSDETFELPAYRELLFLYSIARDLAEHAPAVATDKVDVLLPFADDAAEGPISRLTATTMMGDFQASDLMTMPLDLDVSFAEGGPQQASMRSPQGASKLNSALDSNFIDFDLSEPLEPPPSGSSGTR